MTELKIKSVLLFVNDINLIRIPRNSLECKLKSDKTKYLKLYLSDTVIFLFYLLQCMKKRESLREMRNYERAW